MPLHHFRAISPICVTRMANQRKVYSRRLRAALNHTANDQAYIKNTHSHWKLVTVLKWPSLHQKHSKPLKLQRPKKKRIRTKKAKSNASSSFDRLGSLKGEYTIAGKTQGANECLLAWKWAKTCFRYGSSHNNMLQHAFHSSKPHKCNKHDPVQTLQKLTFWFFMSAKFCNTLRRALKHSQYLPFPGRLRY